MAIWTKGHVYISSDKSTYLQYDEGTKRLNIYVNGTQVGYMTSTGVVWLVGQSESAQFLFLADVLAAAGTNQGTAALIAKQLMMVTGADNTKGVVLPVSAQGEAVFIVNTDATHYLLVYPDSGATMNGGSANVAVNLLPGTGAWFTCDAALTWVVPLSYLYIAGRDAANLVHTGGMPARVSTDGTEKTTVVTETYIAQIHIQRPMLVTGIAVMNGSTPAGSFVVALADETGAVVANSALAGTASSGADSYQRVALTAAYFARPGTYYVLLQCNSASGQFNSHTFGDFRTAKKTGEVFGTLTTITPPTTFTTALGPIASLY